MQMAELAQPEIEAAGRVQAALSNACGAYVRAVLAANGVSQHFAAQLGADDVPAPKPAPDGLLMCCSTLAVDPAQVIFPPVFLRRERDCEREREWTLVE